MLARATMMILRYDPMHPNDYDVINKERKRKAEEDDISERKEIASNTRIYRAFVVDKKLR